MIRQLIAATAVLWASGGLMGCDDDADASADAAASAADTGVESDAMATDTGVESDAGEGAGFGTAEDIAYGQALWPQVEARADDFIVPAGLDGWQVGAAPHAPHQLFHANGSDPDAEGYIVIKANYMEADETTLDAITVMVKRPGYNPAAHDWFFAKYRPDGTFTQGADGTDEVGRVPFCADCHSHAEGDDYLFRVQ